MVRLTGHQWGLVAMVAGTPFLFAFLLAASSPGLVEPVLGTALGGASWLLAALLGLLGGAVFAGCLGTLARSPAISASPVRRSLGLVFASLVPMGLCIVPALCLMLAGPALAMRLERGALRPREERFHPAQELAERLRYQLPRVLPRIPRLGSW
ncbi:hypothetical protein [Archangium lansingense]|uniref:Uncharacterized protein n=1 Tax=Archangium lansingense TaxID=2995310 RepID=A0ABT4A8S5_9BACT|nr:hypothetical protein [Archangium lansinium]MCY1077736.1 hypothetical protein [Archangium lansinium]